MYINGIKSTFLNIAKDLPQGLIIIDKKGNPLDFSSNIEEIIGYNKKDIETNSQFAEICENCINEINSSKFNGTANMIKEIIQKDGRKRQVLIKAVKSSINKELMLSILPIEEVLNSDHLYYTNTKEIADITDKIENNTGKALLLQLCTLLSEALDADITFIGRNHNTNSVRTIVVTENGEESANFVYSLQGTPCSDVLDNELCMVNAVDDKYPEDKLLIELGVKSYIGLPITNSNGENIGIIVSLFRTDVNFWQFRYKDILQYFTPRISAELQRMEFEETLEKTNKDLSKTNKELDNFVYRISHDLKAPLSSIKGLINLTRIAQDSNESSHYIDLIEETADKLDNLIVDILNYSRNSRLEVVTEPIDMKMMVQNILSSLNYYKEKNDVVLRVDVDETPFYSDKLRLEYILKNIVSNALKFKDSKKEKSIISIKFRFSRGKGILEVTDNGVGIKEEYKDKIFDMFFRGSADFSGSGLGLYIVKECVERLKGEVMVTSDYGATTFVVELPNNLAEY